jgi:hypothetical protein
MFVAKLFKPRPLTKRDDSQGSGYVNSKPLPYGRGAWESHFIDSSTYQIPKSTDGWGMISKLDLDDGQNYYSLGDYRRTFPNIDINELGIGNHMNMHPDGIGQYNYRYTPWNLYAALGHNMKHTCGQCKDTEVKPVCISCDGEGIHPCDGCGAEGGWQCGDCDGEGNQRCYECDGEGNQGCDECDGSGEIGCEKCPGDGSISETCKICDGEGEIEGEGEGKDACSECDGEGEIVTDCPDCNGGLILCGDCDGDGTLNCDYCEGDGTVYCESCNDGWYECGDCYGDGNKTCHVCEGNADGGECDLYSVPHTQDKKWIMDNERREQSIIQYWRTPQGMELAKNYFKHKCLVEDLHKGSRKSKWLKEKGEAAWELAPKYLGKFNKKTRAWSINWNRKKMWEHFESVKRDEYDISSDLLTYHLPFFIIKGHHFGPKGDKVEEMKKLYKQFKFTTSLATIINPMIPTGVDISGQLSHEIVDERLVHYLTSPIWDKYLTYMNIKCKTLKQRGKYNILDYNPSHLSWIYATGPSNYSRANRKPINAPSLTMVFESRKGSIESYIHKLYNDSYVEKELNKRLSGRAGSNYGTDLIKAKIAYKLYKIMGDDFIGFWKCANILRGDGAAHHNVYGGDKMVNEHFGLNRVPKKSFPTYFIVVKRIDNIKDMKLDFPNKKTDGILIGDLGSCLGIYCKEDKTIYKIRHMEPVKPNNKLIPGFPNFPWIDSENILIFETSLRFNEYPFMNWTINKGLISDQKS